MAKKAKIDLLDVGINEENRASSQNDSAMDTGNDEARDDKKPSWIHAWTSRLKAGRQKILLILIVTVLFVAIAGGSMWLYHVRGEKAPVSTQHDAQKTVNQTGERVALFDHFIVDVRDKKGNIRIALCDIAVELEHPRAAGAAGEQVEVRNVIYAVLKRETIVDRLLPEGRELIKIQLKNELDRLLGVKTVKNVYITRFEVI
ncbi:MAG: flagellar basal body-associated FliL family protein [Pseudomonadota bacterium]